jgi:hypothetical protein
MSFLSSSLYSPQIKTDHPILVTPNLDIADDNTLQVIPGMAALSSGKHTEAYDITWEVPVFDNGLIPVSYNLYGSMSPLRKDNLLQEGLKTTECIFYPPWFSETVVYYFWVTAVFEDESEMYITEYPATLESTAETKAFDSGQLTYDACLVPNPEGLNCEIIKAIKTIRGLDKLQLELNGEDAFLYLRRHGEDKPWSRPCMCLDQNQLSDSDPDYQGAGNCKYCFGTGVFGGFYPAIPTKVRYSNGPKTGFKKTYRGFEVDSSFNTYMLHHPLVRTGDLLVLVNSGKRYTVTENIKDFTVRAIRTHQEFDIQQIEKMSILYEVTDSAIQKSLDSSGLPDYLLSGYKIFG